MKTKQSIRFFKASTYMQFFRRIGFVFVPEQHVWITFKWAMLLVILFGITPTSQGQVTVGSDDPPAPGALMQYKEIPDATLATDGRNAYRGMVLPRVRLSSKRNLYPMFLRNKDDVPLDGNRTPEYVSGKATLDKAHVGMTVYNLAEVKSEQLEEGINVWDGEKWVALSKSLGNAIFTFDCNTTAVQVLGSYVVHKELTVSNTLKIKVNVTSPGSYELNAVTANGYFFATSGTFLSTGEFTIYAQGQGTPTAVRSDVLTFTKNGEPVNCAAIVVDVLSDVANYTLDCRNTTVHGVYWSGQALTTTHNITLHVNVSEVGSWSVTSDVVDGISFAGQGTFTNTGIQPIVLYGSGIPSSVVTKNMTFTSNSKGGQSMFCSTKIRITIPRKKILSLGDGAHSIGATDGIGNMFKNTRNFGSLEESTFKTETPVFATTSIIDGEITNSKIAAYVNPSTGKPVDIIFMSFSADIYNNSDVRTLLLNYLKKGGTIILFNEHLQIDAGSNPGTFNFLKAVFNNPAITATDNYIPAGHAWIQKMPNIDNDIFNGPFGDIRGLYCGNDNGYEDVFTYLPAEDLEWSIPSLNYGGSGTEAGRTNDYLIFKHKSYNLIWCGDGGYAAAGNGSETSSSIYPVTTSGAPNYVPRTRLYGNSPGGNQQMVHNAEFIANILAWAIYQSELNGINSH